MRRSFSGPLLLLAIGALFLWRNLHPEAPVFDLLAQYWPFVLIAWGLLRLIEGLIWHREGVRGSFTGGDSKDVTVNGRKVINAYRREDADRTNTETPVEIITQGDRLVVRTNQDHVMSNQRITDDLDVTVPRGMAVESRGASGDHEVGDVDGDVEIASSRGDVRLSKVGGNVRMDVSRSDLIRAMDVKGRIDLQGRGSDVELENVAGQVTISGSFSGSLNFKNLAKPLQFEGTRGTELSAQAVPGRISMDLGEFSASDVVGPIRLVSRARDIKLEQFTQSVELETDRGDIEMTPGKLPLAAIDARSGSGKIELLLPEKAAFQLEATAERGDAVNDFGPQIEKQSEGRSATLKGRVGDGPNIKLTANRGWISVRKEGTMPSEVLPDTPKNGRPPMPPRAPKVLKAPGEIKM